MLPALGLPRRGAWRACGGGFRCAGRADLVSHVGTADISAIDASWAGGYFWQSSALMDTYRAASSIQFIQHARAPVLIQHGVDDPRVPLSQAFQLHVRS